MDLHTRPLTGGDWDWAGLVMLTGMLVQRPHFLMLLTEAKRRGKIVAAGGPYPTGMTAEVMAHGGDLVVRGEAEGLIPQFLTGLHEGRTPAVFESPDKPSLTTSPIPRFDLLNF